MPLVSQPRLKLVLAALLLGATSPIALAQSANVVLENVTMTGKDAGKTLFKRIEVTGTNLSKEEVAKLFAGGNKDEAAALAKKMKAQKISIPEAVFTDKDSTVTFRDFQANGVNEGKVTSATLKGFEGKGKAKGGESTFKSGAIEIGGLAFSSALAAASGGDLADGSMQLGKLAWSGFEMTFPDEDMKATIPGANLIRISLASFTADGTYDGEIPLKGKGEAKGLVIEPPKGSKFGAALNAFGYDKINMGFVATGEYDKAKKTYNIDNFTISGVNAGALGLKLLVGGIDPSFFTAKKDAKIAGIMGGDVSSLTLRYDNSGLFEKAVDYMAKQQKKSPADLKKEWSAMATQFVPMLLGGDPSSLKLAEAVSRFIATPKNLTISMKAKDKPLKFTDLATIKDPQSLLSKVNLDAVAGQ